MLSLGQAVESERSSLLIILEEVKAQTGQSTPGGQSLKANQAVQI